jgi:uncharacterized protein (DUF2236 family)
VPADRAAFERHWDSAPREVRIDRPARELLRRLMMLEFLPLPVNAALGPVNEFLTAGSCRRRSASRCGWAGPGVTSGSSSC